jgi:hypothetical protein
MSHLVTIPVEVKSLPALYHACKRLGFTFHEGQQTFANYGRWVGDSPLPEGFLNADELAAFQALTPQEQKHYMTGVMAYCHHAITVPEERYQVGVHFRHGRYHLLFDSWQNNIADKIAGLPQAYAIELARLHASSQGHTCSERTLDDGSVELTIHDQVSPHSMPGVPPCISVAVSSAGLATITTTGYQGSACQLATVMLERSLGQKTSDTPTGDAYSASFQYEPPTY